MLSWAPIAQRAAHPHYQNTVRLGPFHIRAPDQRGALCSPHITPSLAAVEPQYPTSTGGSSRLATWQQQSRVRGAAPSAQLGPHKELGYCGQMAETRKQELGAHNSPGSRQSLGEGKHQAQGHPALPGRHSSAEVQHAQPHRAAVRPGHPRAKFTPQSPIRN